MNAYQSGKIVPLTERGGAPRHDDDKTSRLIQIAVKAALREHDRTVVSEMRNMTARVEEGFHRMADSIEAFVSGDREVAVATLTADLRDDLPSLSAFKASPLIVYPLKTSDIADALNIRPSVVSYLLNSQGLNWTTRKPELWDKGLYEKTKRRLWHHRTVELLKTVIQNPEHPEREGISDGCKRLLQAAVAAIT